MKQIAAYACGTASKPLCLRTSPIPSSETLCSNEQHDNGTQKLVCFMWYYLCDEQIVPECAKNIAAVNDTFYIPKNLGKK